MSPSREIFLTMNDVEQAIRAFEERHHLSTAEFLKSAECRKQIPEDDVFMWEAYIDHGRALRNLHQQVHEEYLAKLTHTADEGEEAEDPRLLAA